MNEYKLDKRDKDIIAVFCNNARLSYNQIAKITHISKDSVRNRILRLEKEKYILSYFPLINHSKIGVSLINVYCKLKFIEYVSKDQIKHLIRNPDISAITWLIGKFDLELQIIAKNIKEVKNILSKSGFLDKIQEYKIVATGRPLIYSTTHLNAKEIGKPNNESNEPLDKIDRELIELLCINARERIIDLAYKLKLKEDEVRYRIKRLIQKDIILGFYARTDRSFMGLTKYLTLITLKNKIKKEEIHSLVNMKNVFYLKESLGKWNYLLRFHTAVDRELVKTFYNLRKTFSKNLIDFKVHTILEILKFSPSPKLTTKKV